MKTASFERSFHLVSYVILNNDFFDDLLTQLFTVAAFLLRNTVDIFNTGIFYPLLFAKYSTRMKQFTVFLKKKTALKISIVFLKRKAAAVKRSWINKQTKKSLCK